VHECGIHLSDQQDGNAIGKEEEGGETSVQRRLESEAVAWLELRPTSVFRGAHHPHPVHL
jgi:hypothetical protein